MQGSDFVPLVVVGNKSDLKHDQRQVSAEEGRKIGNEFGCAWTEASARLDENVSQAFSLMIGEVEKLHNPNEANDANKCLIM